MTPDRPILRYFGGKWMLAPWIIEHFPSHRIYVEPFGGGASVLLRKPRSYAEVYNDLDGEIVNVFRVMRDQYENLRWLLERTPFSRDEYYEAHEESADPVEQARRSIVRSFMGHGADSLTRRYRAGFRAKSHYEEQGRCAALDWVNYMPAMEALRERLMGVVIENRDAFEVMAMHDGSETLHFVDPPYVHSTRSGGKHGYRHEMTNEDHERLIDFLKFNIRGMVILCGYGNALYRSRLDWECIERPSFADGARPRTEVLWLNPSAINAQKQKSLFKATQ